MIFSHTFKTALTGLKTHKSRSALTILGIVIGITSIILIMSVGQGAQNLILGQIQGLGSRTIAVIPGREPSGPSDFAQIFSDSLKERDLTLLMRKDKAPTVAEVMPIVFGGQTASYGSETYRLTLFGASDLISKIFDLYPAQGAFFTEEDIRGRADVVVIGSKVKDKLFGQSDALGERIRIGGRNLRIIGILPKKGQVSFFNFDEMALMPYTTAQQYIFGIKYFHRFIVEANADDAVLQTVRDITSTLRESHNITDSAKDDFFVQTSADLASRLATITNVLTLLLVSVAAVSLLVGGIGIMNIMLVSVTERTREIGLRKALGATDRDIMRQFLFEAVMLTAVGGVIGILLGAFLSFATALVLSRVVGLSWTFSFPVSAALIGFVVAAGVGLAFGLYPARQASQKSPIEALRYE
ncbi:ABC transporter permease [Patescibacteria group bacterium]|nr:ABC transporter permease [Patescibacteria group bacterium]